MSGKTDSPVPPAYARWCRVDFPGLTDSVITERWRQDSDAEHEFWAAVAAQDARPAPEIRTCYCGTTATVVPGAFPHRDCDGSVKARPASASQVRRHGAQAASDLADDFYFERKQVVELRAVLGEVFTCLGAGDPALLDEEQVAEWRERAGMEES